MTDIDIAREGVQARITLRRELTAEETPLIQLELKQEAAGGAREIVFDMSETESLDCSGICLLVAARNSMRAVDGTVCLIGVSSDIFRMLQGMRLAECLNAVPASGGGANG